MMTPKLLLICSLSDINHYFKIRNFGDIYNGAVYRVGLLSCACSQRKVFYTILPFIVTILCALFW